MPPTKPKPEAHEGEIVDLRQRGLMRFYVWRWLLHAFSECSGFGGISGRDCQFCYDEAIQTLRRLGAEHAARAGAGKRGGK